MAGTEITVVATGTLPTTALCIAEIKAPANQCLVIRGIDYTEGGIDDTDAHTVITSTIGGTVIDGTAGTAPSVSKADPDNTVTIQTTARANFSVNPTSTNEVAAKFGGQSPARVGLPPFRTYIRVKQGTCYRVFADAETANPYTITFTIEE